MSIENYTIYCGDDHERKVGGSAVAVKNDYNTLVEEFAQCLPDAPLYDCEITDCRRKPRLVSGDTPTETVEDNNKNPFHGELNALMSRLFCQQKAIVGIDANAKMGPEESSMPSAHVAETNPFSA
ncbi:hypothetical protein RB195_007164 [Necator americanus]|uniref:Uncharacterized protein n=1 Tax=Necator americanus TaxID=51031 RepID=A0ABR1BVY1_NECAM